MKNKASKTYSVLADSLRKVVLENALDAVIAMDERGLIIDWNLQAEKTFGWNKAEVVESKLADIVIPPSFRKPHDEGLERFLKTGQGPILNQRIEVTALHKNGHIFPVELTVIPLPVEDSYVFYSFLRDISERKKTEEELNKLRIHADLERIKFETIFAQSPAIMALVRGPDFIFEKTNEAYQRLIGFRDVIGKPFVKALPEMKNSPFVEVLKKVFATGESYQVKEAKVQLQEKEGGDLKEVYLDFNYERISAVPGEPYGIIGTAVDVTEKVVSRKLVEESEAQFRSLVNAIPQLAFMSDLDGNVYWYNDQWYSFTGSSFQEMQGDGWKKVYHPEHLDRVVKKREESWGKGEYWEDTFPLKSKNGEYRWFLARATPIKDLNGSIVRYFGTYTDITEQIRAEERLRFLSEATRELISDADYHQRLQKMAALLVPKYADWCVVDLINKEGKIEAAVIAHENKEKISLVKELRQKYPPRADAPTGPAHVIQTKKPDFVPVVTSENLKAVSQSEEHFRILSDLKLKSYICAPLSANNETFGAITLVATELSRTYTLEDLKFIEQLADRAGLAITNARLLSEAKAGIHARDEFLSIASHELKTPLTSLKLQMQSARRKIQKQMDPTTTETFLNLLEKNLSQLERLVRLVDDMLDLSRINSGKLSYNFSRTNLYEVVNDVFGRLKDQFEESGGKLSFSSDSTLLEGMFDRERIEQVVINLLTNAMKYGKDRPVEMKLFKEKGQAKLLVKDKGIGIDSENFDKIFERFERIVSASEVSGLGIGLYITKQIVEAHGGSISVESKVDEGTTFCVLLPNLL